ncbi:MAG: transporter substrate-binding domain-containing protein [Chloroflexota bacterium]
MRQIFCVLLIMVVSLTLVELSRAQNQSNGSMTMVWWEFDPFIIQNDGKLIGFGVDLLDFSLTAIDSGSQIVVPISTKTNTSILSIILDTNFMRIIGYGVLILISVAHIVWLVERRQNDPDFRKAYLPGIWDGFWWACVTITTVGYGDTAPKGTLGRIVAIGWMFAGLFLVTLFIAEITTALTVSRLDGGISSPDDLRNACVATVANTAFETYLNELGVAPQLVNTLPELLASLEMGEVDAIVLEVNAARHYVLSRGRGRAELAGSVFRPVEMAFALPTDSPHREAFNRALLQIKEDGRYDMIYAKWFGARE